MGMNNNLIDLVAYHCMKNKCPTHKNKLTCQRNIVAWRHRWHPPQCTCLALCRALTKINKYTSYQSILKQFPNIIQWTQKHEISCVFLGPLTFKLEGELIGIVEGEHLLVGRLLICVEDELSGEHEHGKVSFHQLRLSMLLLHWLQLSSSPSPSTVCLLGPRPFSTHYQAVKTPFWWKRHFPLSASERHDMKLWSNTLG